jgi:hypothetical protein
MSRLLSIDNHQSPIQSTISTRQSPIIPHSSITESTMYPKCRPLPRRRDAGAKRPIEIREHRNQACRRARRCCGPLARKCAGQTCTSGMGVSRACPIRSFLDTSRRVCWSPSAVRSSGSTALASKRAIARCSSTCIAPAVGAARAPFIERQRAARRGVSTGSRTQPTMDCSGAGRSSFISSLASASRACRRR